MKNKQLIINGNNLESKIKSIATKYKIEISIISKDKIYVYTSYNWLLDVKYLNLSLDYLVMLQI